MPPRWDSQWYKDALGSTTTTPVCVSDRRPFLGSDLEGDLSRLSVPRVEVCVREVYQPGSSMPTHTEAEAEAEAETETEAETDRERATDRERQTDTHTHTDVSTGRLELTA
eukprot:225033-Rhodomonas_salina.3